MILWKTIKLLLGLILLFPITTLSFTKGSGSEFVMTTEGQKVELSIYVVDVQKSSLAVEFHFGVGGILMSNMWQQYQMSVNSGGPVKITAGYIKAGEDKPIERMMRAHFEINKGVQLSDFLFTDEKKLEKDFVGQESVELPAGSVIARHYRKKHDGQTVDYWVADSVRPIGLVKLVSKSSKKKSNNYTIELSSLLTNVKPAIDPKKAVAPSKETIKMFTSTKEN